MIKYYLITFFLFLSLIKADETPYSELNQLVVLISKDKILTEDDLREIEKKILTANGTLDSQSNVRGEASKVILSPKFISVVASIKSQPTIDAQTRLQWTRSSLSTLLYKALIKGKPTCSEVMFACQCQLSLFEETNKTIKKLIDEGVTLKFAGNWQVLTIPAMPAPIENAKSNLLSSAISSRKIIFDSISDSLEWAAGLNTVEDRKLYFRISRLSEEDFINLSK